MEVTEAMAATEAMELQHMAATELHLMAATEAAMVAATETMEFQHMVGMDRIKDAHHMAATEAMVAMDRIKDVHHKVVMVAINKINTMDKVKINGKGNRIVEISTVVTNNNSLTTVHRTNINPLTVVIEFASF